MTWKAEQQGAYFLSKVTHITAVEGYRSQIKNSLSLQATCIGFSKGPELSLILLGLPARGKVYSYWNYLDQDGALKKRATFSLVVTLNKSCIGFPLHSRF